jgi:hypothetical protein
MADGRERQVSGHHRLAVRGQLPQKTDPDAGRLLGRRRELDATFLQPLLGAGQAESFFRLPFACVRAAIYVQDFTCGECGLS